GFALAVGDPGQRHIVDRDLQFSECPFCLDHLGDGESRGRGRAEGRRNLEAGPGSGRAGVEGLRGEAAGILADLRGGEGGADDAVVPFTGDGGGGHARILRGRVHQQLELVEIVDQLLGFLVDREYPAPGEVDILAFERRELAGRRLHLDGADVLHGRRLLAVVLTFHAPAAQFRLRLLQLQFQDGRKLGDVELEQLFGHGCPVRCESKGGANWRRLNLRACPVGGPFTCRIVGLVRHRLAGTVTPGSALSLRELYARVTARELRGWVTPGNAPCFAQART